MIIGGCLEHLSFGERLTPKWRLGLYLGAMHDFAQFFLVVIGIRMNFCKSLLPLSALPSQNGLFGTLGV